MFLLLHRQFSVSKQEALEKSEGALPAMLAVRLIIMTHFM